MSFTSFFDEIVLLNLPEREHRLKRSSIELLRHLVPFQTIRATKRENGQQGIYETLTGVLRNAIENGSKNILVFEDDVKILNKGFSDIIELATHQLPERWDMLYLGANLPKPDMVTKYSANLLRVKRALALHAVAYSGQGMERILSLPRQLPIDLQIANFIHPTGHTYMTYPMLCTQHDGVSDIEKIKDDDGIVVGKQTKNDSAYISPRYQKVCKQLNLKP